MRILAGLLDRNDYSNTQMSYLSSYKMVTFLLTFLQELLRFVAESATMS